MSNEIVVLVGFFGFVTAVLWLVIGWRAMKAHEKLADQLTRYVSVALTTIAEQPNTRRENAVQHKLYKQFVLEHSEAERMPTKERHEAFREWLKARGIRQL